MTETGQNFEMVQGDDKLLKPDGGVQDEDGGGTEDLSNFNSLTWTLSTKPGGTQKVSKSESGGGISVTDAANGKLEVNLDPGDTSDLAGRYFHELEYENSDGDKSTLWRGYVTILEEAT